ncbi:S-adenosyl-L-methionine-dependent methyltransferase [Hypoxylon sp. FL1284]|nr:S-adenosyl-L-methionine-dependent methyltransferase [Hypoxylon sp. FL1284]
MESPKEKLRRKKPPPPNPIEVAITAWFHSGALAQHHQQQSLDELVSHAPKRWTVYEPMALLPAGSFATAAWREALLSTSSEQTDELWTRILAEISQRTGGAKLTHLAVNEGIPAALDHSTSSEAPHDDRAPENILRSPTGLHTLYGDFGPATCAGGGPPGPQDFARALWASTRQNGVFQTWAPRWTMFSRGNVKEKARLLGFGDAPNGDEAWAVDLYAGIGYFAFPYARLGLRVLCWELNPWSVEGLRRGAARNGWAVRVVGAAERALPLRELLAGGERIVVFLEDNVYAARRIGELGDGGSGLNILHINCGLLPTSDASWRDAWDMAARSTGDNTWLHLHENVGLVDIDGRAKEVQQYFLDLARESGGQKKAHVEHTELVKTFAPGVWHCVFDLHTTRSKSSNNVT